MSADLHTQADVAGIKATRDSDYMSIDDCVRMVTAADSFAELKQSLPTYAPKFYTRAIATAEAIAQRRVVSAFNAWAEREGREARAFIAKCAGGAGGAR